MTTSKRARLAIVACLLALPGAGLWLIKPSASDPAASGRLRDDRSAAEGRVSAAQKRARELPRTELPASHTPAGGGTIARIKIPSIGVDAPVIRLGLNPDGTLEVSANARETGWWSGGPFPGERGPAVIVGHVDSRAGPAVFFRLRELERGDEVRVTRPGGRTARFVVTDDERVPKDHFPTRRVYGRTTESMLRLITCTGEFDESRDRYPDNLIVFAREAP